MSYTIIGSAPSPYVRKIRMLLEGKEFTFKELDIYGPAGAAELHRVTPIHLIPVLLDGERKIYDSRVIFNYLNMIHRFENFDWDDENLLSIIDGGISAAVNLLLMKRSGLPVEAPSMFVDRQKERVESVLDYMTEFAKGEGLVKWNFLSISLYSFLDWAVFRGLFTLEKRPELQKFLEAHAQRPAVLNTQIPKG
jgi:glutathione S-transferase